MEKATTFSRHPGFQIAWERLMQAHTAYLSASYHGTPEAVAQATTARDAASRALDDLKDQWNPGTTANKDDVYGAVANLVYVAQHIQRVLPRSAPAQLLRMLPGLHAAERAVNNAVVLLGYRSAPTADGRTMQQVVEQNLTDKKS